MPDFTDLISQAKKMQEKIKETQAALKKIEVEGVSGGNSVKVIMNGEGELKKITFDDALFKESKEIFEQWPHKMEEFPPLIMPRHIRQVILGVYLGM